jgi:phospholipid/cholesterol/gamma-HCH transport system substrate-binding protein
MKFSKEARIGLLVAISFLILFAGFYFLKGANLFSGENEYYAYFEDVQGLQPSASVQVKGLGVGRVANIELNEGGRVKVTIAVSKKVKMLTGTSIQLASADLLGTKVINIQQGAGPAEVPEEGELPASVAGGLIDNLSVEITPLIHDLRHVVASLDTVMVGINGMLGPETKQHISSSVASLDVTMQNFSALSLKLKNESDELAGIIRNTNSITSNLAKNNEQITTIINNTQKISDNLAQAPINETVKTLNETLQELQSIVTKINTNEGSLGMLVNDKQMYNNLTETAKTLDALLADLKAHPYRYVNLTIFGRKRDK